MSDTPNLISVTVSVNGACQSYPVEQGTTAAQLVGREEFRRIFQIPDNSSPVVNGVTGQENIALPSGARLTFRTRASSKAA